MTFNNIYAPKDSTYVLIFSYYCGGGDNDYDSNCGNQPEKNSRDCPGNPGMNPDYKCGCRPIEFKINGQAYSNYLETRCYPGSWDEAHDDSIPLPFKAGQTPCTFGATLPTCRI